MITFFLCNHSLNHLHVLFFEIKLSFLRFLGLHGIFVGVGEIIGGLCFGILGHKLVKYGRDPVVLTGFVTTIAAFFIAFINLPGDAPLPRITSKEAFITSNAPLALFTSFLLGRLFCNNFQKSCV